MDPPRRNSDSKGQWKGTWRLLFRVWGLGVIMAVRDNKDYEGVLLCTYCTTITGWVVLLKDPHGE